MFNQLKEIFERPEPFACNTAKELWTDPHTAGEMLKYHLNPEVDVSSRRSDFIERSVDWIVSRFSVGKDTRIADFGCGPGLYTNRLARHSNHVTGIDFSANSIAYATDRAKVEGLQVAYIHADYLEYQTPDTFDLITMIMCDFCALCPEKRAHMLKTFHGMLNPGGHLLLDVYSQSAFDARNETVICEENLLNGFWSASPYYGFLNTFKYPIEKVTLDKYTIIEPDHTRTFFNWLQYFSPADLLETFRLAGFLERTLFENVAGDRFQESGSEIAIVARKD